MHAMREHNSEKDCIQCIQKREHIRRVKREEFLFYFFFILPVSISSTACFYIFYCPFFRQSFYCSRLQAFLNES